MASYDPEAQPPIYDDAIAADASSGATTSASQPHGVDTGAAPDPNHTAFPSHLTTSATEVAVENGIDVGADDVVTDGAGTQDATDPDERTDLEGPDVLPEDDGTLTHPSFGAGVPLHLGMGTGAGEEDVDTSAPLYEPDDDDSPEANESRSLGYIPDANGN